MNHIFPLQLGHSLVFLSSVLQKNDSTPFSSQVPICTPQCFYFSSLDKTHKANMSGQAFSKKLLQGGLLTQNKSFFSLAIGSTDTLAKKGAL